MGVHRNENLNFKKFFSFIYQWGYTGMKIYFCKKLFFKFIYKYI